MDRHIGNFCLIRILIAEIVAAVGCYRYPKLCGINGNIFCLYSSFVRIDNDGIDPYRNLDAVPAIFTCFHLFPGPCSKGIGAIRCRPRPQAGGFPGIIYFCMYHKFLYVSRCLSGSPALIRDLYGVRCTHRDPCCIGIQNLLLGLHAALIGIDDHMIRPCRKPDIIPTVISCICFHLLAGPCCKRIIAVAVPRPHTRIFPVLRHLHIKRISLFCILCCFCICRHRQNPDHQQKHHQK